MNAIVIEIVNGKRKNTFFETMADAKAYCVLLSKAGRNVMRMRNAR